MRQIRNESGSALLITLSLLALMSAAAVMGLERSTTDIDLSYNQLHDEQAFYTAEAGLHRAIAKLAQNPDWDSGFANIGIGEGCYTLVVIDSISQPALRDTLVLHSTGFVRKASAQVEAYLVPDVNRPFQYALFGDDSVIVENRMTTDSYNSDSGSYSATLDYLNGSIASNGKVSITNNASVGGDASTALERGLVIEHNAEVLGDTTTKANEHEIAPIPESEFEWAEASSAAPGGFSGSSYSYDPDTHELTVHHQGKLTLASGVYYFSDINLRQQAEIELEPDAQVIIYMTGGVLLENSSEINSGGAPSDFMVFSKGTIFELENATEFSGTVYAPNMEFELYNNTNFYGSMVAKRIYIRNRSAFHYDRNLSDVEYGESGDYVLVAWREL